MSERAKLFADDEGQGVRLPPSCRFPEGQEEVLVRREGKRVILEPLDERSDVWSEEFIRTLGSVDEEIERPPSEPPRDPFA